MDLGRCRSQQHGRNRPVLGRRDVCTSLRALARHSRSTGERRGALQRRAGESSSVSVLEHITAGQRLGAEVIGLGTYGAFLLRLLPTASLVLTIVLISLSIAVRVQEWRLNGRKLRGGSDA